MVSRELTNDSSKATGQLKSIRVLPELRAVQVERAAHMTPARTIFLGEKYDLGTTLLPPSMKRLTPIRTAMSLFFARETVLELPEPLWLRFLPKAVFFSLAWRAGGILLNRSRQTVTYAIENNDLDALLFGRRKPQVLVSKILRLALRSFISLSFDRIAFGSAGACESYESLGLSPKVITCRWDELPAANPMPPARPRSSGAIFVGRLEERKGIEHLISAWSEVEKNLPNASLTIVGGGDLESVVDAWSQERPKSRAWAGEIEHRGVSELINKYTVLVAPSIRWGRWREQIGLPIGEGLQNGLTVVTTDETGLANWLKSNGHHVVPVERVSSDLAEVITRAVSLPLSNNAVRDSLPSVPGRIAADRWLHTPLEAVSAPQDTPDSESAGR